MVNPILQKKNAFIFGAGDVVAKRLLPALKRANLFKDYTIYHEGFCLINKNITTSDLRILEIGQDISVDEAISTTRSSAGAIFLATPPKPRMRLLKQLGDVNIPTIIEKPIYVDREGERVFYKEVAFRKCFCLSYYCLEKALPWTSLFRPHPIFDGLLNIDPPVTTERLAEMIRTLGCLRSLTINICEGVDRSPSSQWQSWSQESSDGVFFDMGVHIFALAAKVISPEFLSQKLQLKATFLERRPQQFCISGSVDSVLYNFKFGKHFSSDQCKRTMSAEFEGGTVVCNFDAQNLTITHGKTVLGISLKEENLRYVSQLKLVEKYLEMLPKSSWPKRRFDDLEDQLKSIKALMNISDRFPHFFGEYCE